MRAVRLIKVTVDSGNMVTREYLMSVWFADNARLTGIFAKDLYKLVNGK